MKRSLVFLLLISFPKTVRTDPKAHPNRLILIGDDHRESAEKIFEKLSKNEVTHLRTAEDLHDCEEKQPRTILISPLLVDEVSKLRQCIDQEWHATLHTIGAYGKATEIIGDFKIGKKPAEQGLGFLPETTIISAFSEEDRLTEAIKDFLSQRARGNILGIEKKDVFILAKDSNLEKEIAPSHATLIVKNESNTAIFRGQKAPSQKFIQEIENRMGDRFNESVPHESNLLGLPSPLKQKEKKEGSILIAGGITPDVTFERFFKLAGEKKGRVVVIPSASIYHDDEDYFERNYGHWMRYGFADVEVLHTDDREQANTNEFVKKINEATGVWIGGGFQSRLAGRYVSTKVEEAIINVYRRGGVIGGTSAGATIFSDMCILWGRKQMLLSPGFAVFSRAVIDQHFSEENRFNRLLDVTTALSDYVGIGIDEETVLEITRENYAVHGEGNVYFFVPKSSKDFPGRVFQLFRLPADQQKKRLDSLFR